MKKKLALIAPVLLIGASNVMADDCGLTPYVGLDAQVRHMSYKSGFGGNLFNHNYPQGNVYVGLKFNNCIGIEVGFSGGPKRTRSATLNAGDINLGVPLVGELVFVTPLVYSTTTRVSGVHADLVGFYPVNCDMQVFGSVGANRLKAHFSQSGISSGPESLIGTAPLRFKKHKTVLRLGLGLQQMLTCNVGLRAGLIWENTSKLNNIRLSQLTTLSDVMPTIKLRDSLVYSLGIFWQF